LAFITRTYHDAQSSEHQIKKWNYFNKQLNITYKKKL